IRKDTQVPQPSDPIENVADEAVYKELGDNLVRATTTASSLEVEQDSEIMRDTTAQTRIESVSKPSNDSLLARGNTLRSDEDSLKLNELMALCTTLQNRVLDLEKTKTTQQNEIASLKRRVKKLKNKKRSKTHMLKRLYKVGLTATVESSDNVSAAGDIVSAASVATKVSAAITVSAATTASAATATTTATNTIVDDITLAQALEEKKITKPKQKGVVIQELDQIRLDEEIALKLQATFDEEERLAREKVGKVEEANIALIETWDAIQAKIDVDHQLAEKMQAQEQEELFIEENATLFQQLLEKKRKHFAAKRA
ncbi:hypothetical protein Tco_1464015, partial [Tanacetum coccineum]